MPQQRLCVPCADQLLADQALHSRRKLEEAEQVRHCGTTPTDTLGDLILGVGEVFDQLLVRGGFFQGVQVLAMEVLHQRLFQQCLIVSGADHHRNRPQTRPLGGAEAPFARDQLVPVVERPHQNRLQHPQLLDRIRQPLEGLFVERTPGLVRVRSDQLNRNLSQPSRDRSLRIIAGTGGDQRGEPSSKTRLTSHRRSPLVQVPGTPPHHGNWDRTS